LSTVFGLKQKIAWTVLAGRFNLQWKNVEQRKKTDEQSCKAILIGARPERPNASRLLVAVA
jgi:hypothetical protein